jgi:hypothetical protein
MDAVERRHRQAGAPRLATVINKALARVILEKSEALPRASDYYRQYGGLYRHGRRVVYVCGLHRWLLEATAKTAGRDTWMRTAMGADDGGLAGWEVQLESGLRGYLFAPDVEASR